MRVVNVTEDCGQQAEYCQLDLRTQAISQETILCRQPGDVVRTLQQPSSAQYTDLVCRCATRAWTARGAGSCAARGT